MFDAPKRKGQEKTKRDVVADARKAREERAAASQALALHAQQEASSIRLSALWRGYRSRVLTQRYRRTVLDRRLHDAVAVSQLLGGKRGLPLQPLMPLINLMNGVYRSGGDGSDGVRLETLCRLCFHGFVGAEFTTAADSLSSLRQLALHCMIVGAASLNAKPAQSVMLFSTVLVLTDTVTYTDTATSILEYIAVYKSGSAIKAIDAALPIAKEDEDDTDARSSGSLGEVAKDALMLLLAIRVRLVLRKREGDPTCVENEVLAVVGRPALVDAFEIRRLGDIVEYVPSMEACWPSLSWSSIALKACALAGVPASDVIANISSVPAASANARQSMAAASVFSLTLAIRYETSVPSSQASRSPTILASLFLLRAKVRRRLRCKNSGGVKMVIEDCTRSLMTVGILEAFGGEESMSSASKLRAQSWALRATCFLESRQPLRAMEDLDSVVALGRGGGDVELLSQCKKTLADLKEQRKAYDIAAKKKLREQQKLDRRAARTARADEAPELVEDVSSLAIESKPSSSRRKHRGGRLKSEWIIPQSAPRPRDPAAEAAANERAALIVSREMERAKKFVEAMVEDSKIIALEAANELAASAEEALVLKAETRAMVARQLKEERRCLIRKEKNDLEARQQEEDASSSNDSDSDRSVISDGDDTDSYPLRGEAGWLRKVICVIDGVEFIEKHNAGGNVESSLESVLRYYDAVGLIMPTRRPRVVVILPKRLMPPEEELIDKPGNILGRLHARGRLVSMPSYIKTPDTEVAWLAEFACSIAGTNSEIDPVTHTIVSVAVGSDVREGGPAEIVTNRILNRNAVYLQILRGAVTADIYRKLVRYTVSPTQQFVPLE